MIALALHGLRNIRRSCGQGCCRLTACALLQPSVSLQPLLARHPSIMSIFVPEDDVVYESPSKFNVAQLGGLLQRERPSCLLTARLPVVQPSENIAAAGAEEWTLPGNATSSDEPRAAMFGAERRSKRVAETPSNKLLDKKARKEGCHVITDDTLDARSKFADGAKLASMGDNDPRSLRKLPRLDSSQFQELSGGDDATPRSTFRRMEAAVMLDVIETQTLPDDLGAQEEAAPSMELMETQNLPDDLVLEAAPTMEIVDTKMLPDDLVAFGKAAPVVTEVTETQNLADYPVALRKAAPMMADMETQLPDEWEAPVALPEAAPVMDSMETHQKLPDDLVAVGEATPKMDDMETQTLPDDPVALGEAAPTMDDMETQKLPDEPRALGEAAPTMDDMETQKLPDEPRALGEVEAAPAMDDMETQELPDEPEAHDPAPQGGAANNEGDREAAPATKASAPKTESQKMTEVARNKLVEATSAEKKDIIKKFPKGTRMEGLSRNSKIDCEASRILRKRANSTAWHATHDGEKGLPDVEPKSEHNMVVARVPQLDQKGSRLLISSSGSAVTSLDAQASVVCFLLFLSLSLSHSLFLSDILTLSLSLSPPR